MKIDTKKLNDKVKNNGAKATDEDFEVGAVDGVDDGEDFTLGTIAGMEDENVSKKKNRSGKAKDKENKKEESGATMTTATAEKPTVNVETTSNPKPEELADTVSLKVHKTNQKLVDVLAKKNDGVIVQEFETHYQLNAKQLRITRQDAETALGKMNDGRWRMLLMNRDGEVVNFNNYELVLGVVEAENEESKETAQLNTKILAEAKQEMDEIRAMLGMTQAQFLEVVIKEYAEKVRAEML